MLNVSLLLPSGATQQSNSAGSIAIPELLPTLQTPQTSLLPSSWDETEYSLSRSTCQPPDSEPAASTSARLQQLQTLVWPSAPLKIEQLIQTKSTKVALNPPWKTTQAMDQHLIDQLLPGCLEVQQEPNMVSLSLCCKFNASGGLLGTSTSVCCRHQIRTPLKFHHWQNAFEWPISPELSALLQRLTGSTRESSAEDSGRILCCKLLPNSTSSITDCSHRLFIAF